MPPVRELNNLVNEIGKSVQPQKNLIDADIIANAQAGQAQEAGLQATAQREYGKIEQGAQNKGMFFSGFSPDEQANYNATSYLPALAQLQATIAGTRSQLLGKKADLDTNVFDKAFQSREGDLDKQFQWKSSEEQRRFEADQANIQRQFSAAESEKDRAAARASQAAQAAARAPSGPSTAQVVGSVTSELQKLAGKDGFVNPKTYHDGRQAWVALGGKPGDYDNTFRGFANPKYLNEYLASGF